MPRALCLSLLLVVAGCATSGVRRGSQVSPCATVGLASWYRPSPAYARTADGERYNPDALTAAHRFLAFGTQVQVTNLENGRSVVVRINDRGPFVKGRIIDLSAQAARTLGMHEEGVIRVRLAVEPQRSGPIQPVVATAGAAGCVLRP